MSVLAASQRSNGNGKRPVEDPPPANQEVPLINNGLEQSLLAAVMETPELLQGIEWRPDHFALDANKQIARAIERTSINDVVNVMNVAVQLKAAGKLEPAGGSKYLGELIDTLPCGVTLEDALSWAKQLRGLWEKRLLLAEARSLAASLATGAVDDHFEAYTRSAQRIESLKPRDETPLGDWATVLGDLMPEPERETWLLLDQMTGKPALPIGRAAMLSAAGGTGKTTTLVQLSIAVALGLSWCGFTVKTPGCVCLCCGESDQKLVKRQMWRAMNALGLDAEQRDRAQSQILILALAGKQVNMIRGASGNDTERTEFLSRFSERLRKLAIEQKFEWSLVALDPLSRFAGPDTEKDNGAATRFAQAVETLCELPGTPSVICAHHSSKNSITAGKNDSRGVSGLRDAFRAVLVMTRFATEGVVGVHMSCDKSNEAPHFQDRWLVQQQGDMGGTLRLATEPEAAMLIEASKPKKKQNKATSTAPAVVKSNARDAVIAKLRALGGTAKSRNWLKENLTSVDHTELQAAFKSMEEDGTITIDASGRTKGTVRLMELDSQASLNLDSRPEEAQASEAGE